MCNKTPPLSGATHRVWLISGSNRAVSRTAYLNVPFLGHNAPKKWFWSSFPSRNILAPLERISKETFSNDEIQFSCKNPTKTHCIPIKMNLKVHSFLEKNKFYVLSHFYWIILNMKIEIYWISELFHLWVKFLSNIAHKWNKPTF